MTPSYFLYAVILGAFLIELVFLFNGKLAHEIKGKPNLALLVAFASGIVVFQTIRSASPEFSLSWSLVIGVIMLFNAVLFLGMFIKYRAPSESDQLT